MQYLQFTLCVGKVTVVDSVRGHAMTGSTAIQFDVVEYSSKTMSATTAVCMEHLV